MWGITLANLEYFLRVVKIDKLKYVLITKIFPNFRFFQANSLPVFFLTCSNTLKTEINLIILIAFLYTGGYNITYES